MHLVQHLGISRGFYPEGTFWEALTYSGVNFHFVVCVQVCTPEYKIHVYPTKWKGHSNWLKLWEKRIGGLNELISPIPFLHQGEKGGIK